jgi:CHAT domain-containing protein
MQAAVNAQIRSEDDMVSALVSGSSERPKTVSTLLRQHHDLVSRSLFNKLMFQGDQISGTDAAKSLQIFEIAKETAEQLGDKKLLAFSLYKIGLVHFKKGNIPQAKVNYLEGKAALEGMGQSSDLILLLGSLANVCLYQDALKEAKEYSQQSISLANAIRVEDKPLIGPILYGVALSWGNLGDIAKAEGHYNGALDFYQKSLEALKSLSEARSEYRADLADAMADIGRVYRVMGDNQRALSFLTEAAAIAKTLIGQDKLASVLNSIGVLYIEQNDYAKASDFINRSLAIYRTTGDRFEIARLLLNQGVINQRQARYQEAAKDFRESLENAEAVDASDLIVAAQEGMGAIYQEQGDGAAALEWLTNALATAERLEDKTREAELLWRSGEAYYLRNDLPKAITSVAGAIKLAEELRLLIISYLALTAKGKYYIAQKNYDLAFQTLSLAIGHIEALRSQVAGSQQEQQLFFENKVESYGLLADVLVKQGKAADALFYVERAKGRVLLDALRDGKPDVSRALSSTENKQLKRLNTNISGLNELIRREQANDRLDATRLDDLFVKLDSARLEYESFQDALFSTHPDLNLRRGHIPTLTSEELSVLARESIPAYLEYIISKDQIYLFVLGGNATIRIYPLSVKPQDLRSKVNEFHDVLAEKRPQYTTRARDLYKLLIAPAEQQLRGVGTICIIPDTFLWNVPFQALMTPSEHFLIEDHAVYYAPSLSVLREMNRKKGKGETTNTSLIAFGNPVVGKDEQRNTDSCPLPEAEQEVSSIAKSFNEQNTKVFIGREASEKSFKTLARTYSIVHLATHGVIDNRQPLYSHLLLTKTVGDPENDGLLEAREIMNMDLNADLAVLSACETANGKIAPGEGVIGMSWAFFVAGTRSMLVSQWKVNSASTAELMVNFYRSLASDQNSDRNKARALREAVLPLISESRNRHPFFWAGFVLIGDSAEASQPFNLH